LDILLVIAVIAIGASGLYVAVTFNTRTRQNTEPLINHAVSTLSSNINGAVSTLSSNVKTGLEDHLTQVRNELAASREPAELQLEKVRTQLERTTSRNSDVTSQFKEELDAMEFVTGQFETRLDELGRIVQELTDQVTGLSESLTRQGAQLAEIHEYLISADRTDRHDRTTVGQMLGTVKQIEMVLHAQGDIQSYLRAKLDFEVTRTSRDDTRRIIAASVYLSRPGADLLWPLLLSFCRTVMLETLLPRSLGLAGSRSYLLWRSADGRPLEDVLSEELATCRDRGESSRADLNALRSLIMGLHVGGPGTVWLGPMVINRTPGAMLGCVLTVAEIAEVSNAGTPASPDACEASLRRLDQDRVIDLTSWADATC
jgi:hypothetical protein